ncbi:hypothetical protein, partial [Magnetospirillum sp. SS-4]|uniref:hypothetical protein n=1 Tax=Magnetospirillum sp. SS-4 TaxID=2681465 RepID=UPI001C2D2381
MAHTQQALGRAVFLGSKGLGISVFKALITTSNNIKWTIIHPNDTDDKRSTLTQWQNLARLLDIDILVSSSNSATKEIIRNIKPDIGFVCGS